MKQIKLFHDDSYECLENKVNAFCKSHSGIICEITFHPILKGEYVFNYASVVYA